MLRKVIIPIVLLTVSLTACGTPNENVDNKTSTLSVVELSDTTAKAEYYPISVTTTEELGEKLVIKNYEIESDVKPSDLVESEFERSGYLYQVRDILRKKLDSDIESKLASKQITINTTTKDMDSVLKQAPVIVDYSDEQGYSGQLLLNTDNVFSESLGSKSYSYKVKETKTYNDLARNDSYYIPKTVEKDGKSLTLTDVEWTTTGTTLAGSSLLPSSYSAKAYYEGTAYGSKSIGYQTTLTYIGEVTREIDNGYLVSIIYSGEKIMNFTWLLILIPVLLIVGGVLLYKNKKSENETLSNTKKEKNYIVDKKVVKESKPRKNKVKGEELNE